MDTTTKNLIALDFNAMDLLKGSFKSFSNEKIVIAKENVINDYLIEKEFLNDKPILIHWHKTMLKILKKRVLTNLIKNN